MSFYFIVLLPYKNIKFFSTQVCLFSFKAYLFICTMFWKGFLSGITICSSLSPLFYFKGFPGGSDDRVCPQCRRPGFGQEDPLEKGMATHSSILVWRIQWTEEPGKLQSVRSQRVGHN